MEGKKKVTPSNFAAELIGILTVDEIDVALSIEYIMALGLELRGDSMRWASNDLCDDCVDSKLRHSPALNSELESLVNVVLDESKLS